MSFSISKKLRIITLSERLQTPKPLQLDAIDAIDAIDSSLFSSPSLLSTFAQFLFSLPVFYPLFQQSHRLPELKKSSPQRYKSPLRYKVLQRQAKGSSPITSSEGIEANLLKNGRSAI